MIPVFTRRAKRGWLQRHAAFIGGSYVGLLAATAAEITSRLPGTEESFGLVVAGTSIVVMASGGALVARYMPGSVSRVPAHFRRATEGGR
jgi:hypothetical protein